MLGNTLHGNWEGLCSPTRRKGGLHWEVQGRNPMINGHGQSDGDIVPEKSPNNSREAEGMEERSPVKGNAQEHPSHRTQSRTEGMQAVLERIRKAVKRDKKAKLTALYHHVYNVGHLMAAYYQLKRKAAAGVDGETWQHYGQELEANLEDLSRRLRRGAYRAAPVRRVYIPKADGHQRGLGIPALEDKIVESVTAQILSVIWEEEFLEFSYGFRPGRSPHHALDALTVGIERKCVRWVLEIDIRAYFDTISHEWLEKFIEHRIGDKRILTLIQKWMQAGVLEEGQWTLSEEGVPQGNLISPILANIYLHYAFDQWAQQWREQQAQGDMIIVRYADDIVVGFGYQSEAEKFKEELAERLKEFNLELHSEKTRLIEFGRYAATNRTQRGEGKPETFNFLGFTHICGKTREGKFCVLRQTMKKRMQAKLINIRMEMKRRMHTPVPDQGQWLRSVLMGHYQYYGVPRNFLAMGAFRKEVVRLWKRSLERRSQRGSISWERMFRLTQKWLPHPHICQPYPVQRLCVTT
jgi:RNA-directed DNA polymerase